MVDARRAKFFRIVLGNIIMCATVAALLSVTVAVGGAKSSAQSGEPYYAGKSDTKVSLMVNVYWGTEYIQPMLDIMSRYVKTTFFVGGSWAAGNSETLKKIHAAGHEIGNHGYYHKDHSKIDGAYNRKEIESAHDAVKHALGIDMTLFAPPSGAFCAQTLSVAAELGYRTVMWTRDYRLARPRRKSYLQTRRKKHQGRRPDTNAPDRMYAQRTRTHYNRGVFGGVAYRARQRSFGKRRNTLTETTQGERAARRNRTNIVLRASSGHARRKFKERHDSKKIQKRSNRNSGAQRGVAVGHGGYYGGRGERIRNTRKQRHFALYRTHAV